MDLDKYLSFTTEEIILDEDFTTWVLHPDKESDSFWERFLDEHPELRPRIREAAFIVRSLQPVEPQAVHAGVEDVLRRIKLDISARKRQVVFNTLKYAAGLLILAGLGFAIFSLRHRVSHFPVAAVDAGTLNRGRIILADGSSHEFDTKQTIIQQTDSGIVMVNNDTIGRGTIRTKQGEASMNQVIIPYGKRSAITLADGTHIWMNSGSQLSYPAEFKKDSREVYLSGEAFFDVRHVPDKPFYVITQEFRIKVLGTRFNISSYVNDNLSQTVLVEGKVRVVQNAVFSKILELEPGERFVYSRKDGSATKDHVDVRFYSSWVDGFLIFENEPTTEVFKKLERYYNRTIIADPAVDKITFSGKLDLKDDLMDVLRTISFASSLQVTQGGAYYIIKP